MNDKKKNETVGELTSLYQRGETWYVNYQLGGRQVRESLKTKKKSIARKKAAAIERDILNGDHQSVQYDRLTVADAVKCYVDHVKSEGRSAKTIAKYVFILSLVEKLASELKVATADGIDVAFVTKFRARRRKGLFGHKPSAAKTVYTDTVLIRQLVRFLLMQGMLGKDRLEKLKNTKPPATWQPCWDRDTVLKIVAASMPPHCHTLSFLAETGVRIGAAKWLSWNDVDFGNNLVHIRAKKGWTPKGKKDRTIPMSDALREMLSSLPRKGKWVFNARPTNRYPSTDRQISERRTLEYLKRLLEGLGLETNGKLHTFRHSFVTHAANQGVPVSVLMSWVGHADSAMVRYYYTLTDQASQQQMRKMMADDE